MSGRSTSRSWAKRLLRSEDGQAVTEYILMLAVVIGIAVGVFSKLRPYLEEFADSAASVVEARLSQGLHEIRIGR